MEQLTRAEWYQFIERWEQSDLTQVDFCTKYNLNVKQFGYFRTGYLSRQPKAPPKPSSSITMLPINIQRAHKETPQHKSSAIIEIKSANGFQLKFSDTTHISYIKQLLAVLPSC